MLEELIQSIGGTVVVCVLLCTVVLYAFPRRQNGVPPGPKLWPIVGNLPALASKNTMDGFAKLRKTYGDVYGIYMGRELNVILNGYDVIHEALVKKGTIFSGRPRCGIYKLMFKDPGIVFANGQIWKEHRQFAQLALKVFGYDGTELTIEERIHDEIHHFIAKIESHTDPFDIGHLVNLSVANVIAGIMFGRRCEYNDPKFVACLHSVGETARLFTRSNLLMNCFPWLIHLPGDLLGVKQIEKIREMPKQFLVDMFAAHSVAVGEKEARDILGYYKQEINAQNGKQCTFTEVTMRAVMGELLSAGSETTATVIIWLILYLILNPDLQRKLQQQIDKVVDTNRLPALMDRERLPLVEATILESQRIAPVAPLSVPHAVHKDVTFRGFHIPKETTVLVNLHSAMKDPNIWPEPDAFKPERFLDQQGRVTIPNEFVPFSIGRRSCPGESLARMELFLVVTSLLQVFDISAADNEPMPTTDGVLGMTYSPRPFKMKATRRHV